MLINTLSRIDGIAAKFEERLRGMGINLWNDILAQLHQFTDLPLSKLEKIKNSILKSK